jgi:hypothetical protein
MDAVMRPGSSTNSQGVQHSGPVRIEANDLLFFIDETGSESLSDPAFPIFGFGSCAVVGRDYRSAVVEPWREMKALRFGGARSAMHASGGPTPDAAQLVALSEFFARERYFRLGAVVKKSTEMSGFDDIHDAASGALQMLIGQLVQLVLPTRVLFFFEDSERGRPLIMKNFGSLRIDRREGDRVEPLPIVQYLMDKRSQEPGLEVADFIAHAAGNQARVHEAGARGWRLDFRSVFQSAPDGLALYADMQKAQKIKVPLEPGKIPGATYIELGREDLGPHPNRDAVGTPHRLPRAK